MQMDLFVGPEVARLISFELLEHAAPTYGPRTAENQRKADVTVAFATDFETAGEKLTAKLAGRKYLGIPYGGSIPAAAEKLIAFLRSREAATLNVAGNGIYTLHLSGYTQEQVNQWVFDVFRKVCEKHRLTHIRSGGQTGVDTAGLVAGLRLGIPVTGLYPKGFLRRLVTKENVTCDRAQLEQEIRTFAQELTV